MPKTYFVCLIGTEVSYMHTKRVCKAVHRKLFISCLSLQRLETKLPTFQELLDRIYDLHLIFVHLGKMLNVLTLMITVSGIDLLSKLD